MINTIKKLKEIDIEIDSLEKRLAVVINNNYYQDVNGFIMLCGDKCRCEIKNNDGDIVLSIDDELFDDLSISSLKFPTYTYLFYSMAPAIYILKSIIFDKRERAKELNKLNLKYEPRMPEPRKCSDNDSFICVFNTVNLRKRYGIARDNI